MGYTYVSVGGHFADLTGLDISSIYQVGCPPSRITDVRCRNVGFLSLHSRGLGMVVAQKERGLLIVEHVPHIGCCIRRRLGMWVAK